MICKFKKEVFLRVLLPIVLGCGLLLGIGISPLHAVVYDFNSLNGSDTYPFTPLNGQDNWTTESFNTGVQLGVVDTLGFDGSNALRFQNSGPGVGTDASRLNDGGFSVPAFTGSETQAFFQADFGVGYWGNQFALGYDADADGVIRRYEVGEIGPQLIIGANDTVAGVMVVSATGISTSVALSSVGGVGWVRLQLIMDFTANLGAGSGNVFYQNLTNGDTSLQPVLGLQGINLGLDPNAADVRNPTLWNGMWSHMEGSTNQLDNINVSSSPVPEPTTLALFGLGALGLTGYNFLKRKK